MINNHSAYDLDFYLDSDRSQKNTVVFSLVHARIADRAYCSFRNTGPEKVSVTEMSFSDHNVIVNDIDRSINDLISVENKYTTFLSQVYVVSEIIYPDSGRPSTIAN